MHALGMLHGALQIEREQFIRRGSSFGHGETQLRVGERFLQLGPFDRFEDTVAICLINLGFLRDQSASMGRGWPENRRRT